VHGSDHKCILFVGKPEVKRAVGSSKRRWEGSIKSPLSLSQAVLLLDCIRWVAGSNPDPATDHPVVLRVFFFGRSS
jgi:hypothetical protein